MIMMPTSDRNWEAEQDARTLAEADMIKKDTTRRTAAEKAAVDMANRQKDEAAAMAKIAKSQLSYPPPISSVENKSCSERAGRINMAWAALLRKPMSVR